MNFAGLLLPFVASAPIATPTVESHGLQRVPEPRGHFDPHAWEERLAARDLDERERSFAEIVELAVADDAAREALRAWSTDAGRSDLAWTARLALREVERRPGTHLRALKQFGSGAMQDLRGRFDELEHRFGGLDSMFEDLQQDLDRLFSGRSPSVPVPPPGAMPQGGSQHGGQQRGGLQHDGLQHGGLQRESQSFRMQSGPDGVKIEVDEDVNGQQSTRTYTGATLDEILEANPELKDKIGSGAQRFFFGGVDALRGFGLTPRHGGGLQLTPDDDDRWSTPARPLGTPDGSANGTPNGTPSGTAKTRTDILGVQYTKPAREVRERRGLEADVGLEVQRTEPGTIAAALGVQPGDVLVALDDRPLKDSEDVARILRERKPGEPVKLELVDGQGRRHTLTWNDS